MIKTLSPYYITTPWLSPLTGLKATSYTLEVFIWNGGKGNSGYIPTYTIEKENVEQSISTDEVNISRIVNDFVNVRPVDTDTTESINADNQIWVKTQVYYTTSDTNESAYPQNVSVDLAIRGYTYGNEGKNAQPTSSILIPNDEYNANKNGVFVVPVLANEIDSSINAVTDSYTIVNTNQDLVVTSNDDLGFTPTLVTSVVSDLDSDVGEFISNGDVVSYVSNDTILSNVVTTFDYTITDSTGASSTTTVNVTIEPLPSTVTAIDDYYTLDNVNTVDLDVMANDILGTPPTTITAFDDSGLTSGTITNNGTDLTFTPNGIIPASDEAFTYTITDTIGSSQATVTLKVLNEDNRYLTFAVNIGTVSGTISGEYANGTPFSFNVAPSDTVNINACVIESSIVESPDVISNWDDNINC